MYSDNQETMEQEETVEQYLNVLNLSMYSDNQETMEQEYNCVAILECIKCIHVQ